MQARIHWNIVQLKEWEALFAQLPASNLLQSYDYARAICPLKRQRARWGVIEIDGVRAGMVQMLEAGVLGNLLHGIVIDRGPLWFEGFGSADHLDAFLRTFMKSFPKRIGRKMRFIPEIQPEDSFLRVLQNHKLNQISNQGYETIAIDLNQSFESLKADLRKNWRNMLSRAEREKITITWHKDGKTYTDLMRRYALDKAEKGYGGPSIAMMNALAKIYLPQGRAHIGVATKDGKWIGSVLLLIHGSGATYQIGWTSSAGRKIGAQHLLLWEGIQHLKQNGTTYFDLGGVNDDSAKGVKKFKEGLGGRLIRLPGIFG